MHEMNVDTISQVSSNAASYAHPTLEEKPGQAAERSLGALLDDIQNVKPNKKYVSFKEAHEFSKSLRLKTRKEWRIYVKEGIPGKPEKPSYIPAHPDGIYKVKGWQGWKYWLGTTDYEFI